MYLSSSGTWPCRQLFLHAHLRVIIMNTRTLLQTRVWKMKNSRFWWYFHRWKVRVTAQITMKLHILQSLQLQIVSSIFRQISFKYGQVHITWMRIIYASWDPFLSQTVEKNLLSTHCSTILKLESGEDSSHEA